MESLLQRSGSTLAGLRTHVFSVLLVSSALFGGLLLTVKPFELQHKPQGNETRSVIDVFISESVPSGLIGRLPLLAFFAGSLLALIQSWWLFQLISPRTLLFATALFTAGGFVATAFVTLNWAVITSRFLTAASLSLCLASAVVLLLDWTQVSTQVTVIHSLLATRVVPFLVLGLCDTFVDPWQIILGFAVALVSALFLAIFTIKESPSWMHRVGKISKLRKTYNTLASAVSAPLMKSDEDLKIPPTVPYHGPGIVVIILLIFCYSLNAFTSTSLQLSFEGRLPFFAEVLLLGVYYLVAAVVTLPLVNSGPVPLAVFSLLGGLQCLAVHFLPNGILRSTAFQATKATSSIDDHFAVFFVLNMAKIRPRLESTAEQQRKTRIRVLLGSEITANAARCVASLFVFRESSPHLPPYDDSFLLCTGIYGACVAGILLAVLANDGGFSGKKQQAQMDDPDSESLSSDFLGPPTPPSVSIGEESDGLDIDI